MNKLKKIKVCYGRTCGPKCAAEIETELKKYAEAHPEKNIQLEKQICFGFCRDANNIQIDDKLCSFQSPDKIIDTLEKLDSPTPPPHRVIKEVTDNLIDELLTI